MTTIKQTTLPYDYNALEPYVSAETLAYHYDKHHSGYVDKLNKLIDGTSYAGLSLEDIVVKARENAAIDILNNALQAWNHSFLWESMSPNGGNVPDGRIKELIEDGFGDLDTFRNRFREAALSHFGSGWVWLVLDGQRLRILTTVNADSPVGTQMLPLLTLDVWEHAYYIDYRNKRAEYVDNFLDKLVNWKFAAANLRDVESRKAA